MHSLIPFIPAFVVVATGLLGGVMLGLLDRPPEPQ